MDRHAWERLVRGDGCGLCAPRPESNDYWDLIATLAISSLYLAKNQTYRGQCQLVFDARHAARLDELSLDEYAEFSGDLMLAQHAITRAMRPDHMNVESLGNVVPHLHWHIIPRYVGDARWGMPIWTTPLGAMPDHRLAESDRESVIGAIQTALRDAAASTAAV